MSSSKDLIFKPKRLYCLPTWRGVAMTLAMGASIGYAIVNVSVVEQWIFFLMVILVSVHLMELGSQFRNLEAKSLPFEAPFAGEHFSVPIRVASSLDMKAARIKLKFQGDPTWTESKRFEGKQFLIDINQAAQKQGNFRTRQLTVRVEPAVGLFYLWRSFEFDQQTYILPRPVNHNASATSKFEDLDSTLMHLEPIRDPRLLPLRDQKLFQKTGLPFLRFYQNQNSDAQITLVWDEISALPLQTRSEQFCYWLQLARLQHASVQIEAPFFGSSPLKSAGDWREFKESFGAWLRARL